MAVVEVPATGRRKRKKDEEAQTLTDNLNVLLLSSFDIISLKAGRHWKLRLEEAEAVSRPAARILIRYTDKETATKYGDILALMVGCLLVVVPRILIGKQTQRREKHGDAEVKAYGESARDTGDTATGDSGGIEFIQPGLSL